MQENAIRNRRTNLNNNTTLQPIGRNGFLYQPNENLVTPPRRPLTEEEARNELLQALNNYIRAAIDDPNFDVRDLANFLIQLFQDIVRTVQRNPRAFIGLAIVLSIAVVLIYSGVFPALLATLTAMRATFVAYLTPAFIRNVTQYFVNRGIIAVGGAAAVNGILTYLLAQTTEAGGTLPGAENNDPNFLPQEALNIARREALNANQEDENDCFHRFCSIS